MSTPSPRYAAFISYSSSGNAKLAQALRRWLERFATPWYARRRFRIFRDSTSLAAGGDLDPDLVRAMADSGWFVLLASPEAARSAWVAKEVGWWREHQPASRVVIVLAGGRLRWDDAASDWDWAQTNALPPTARGMFTAEPVWVDLSSAADTGRLDRSNPELLDKVAQLAAPLRGVDRDTVVGEHLVQARQARRHRRGAVATLAVMLVVSLVATVLAVNNASQAHRQADIASARALAAAAVDNLDSRVGLAQLLAVEAFRLNPDARSRAALFQAITASPALRRFLIAPGTVTRVAASTDTSTILAGTADGDVVRWDANGRRDVLARLGKGVTSLAINPDGTTVAASSGTDAIVWTRGQGVTRLDIPAGQHPSAVAVSPSGRTALLATGAGPDQPGMVIAIDTSTVDTRRAAVAREYSRAVLPSDEELVLLDAGPGGWERRAAADLRQLAAGQLAAGQPVAGQPVTGQPGSGTVNDVAAISADGRVISHTTGDGTVRTWSTGSGGGDPRFQAPGPGADATAQALSTEGSYVATAAGGRIQVAPLRQVTPAAPGTPVGISGGTAGGTAGGTSGGTGMVLTGLPVVNAGALTFLDDGARLIAGSGTDVVLWDTRQVSPVGARLAVTVPASCAGCAAPFLSLSPDLRYAVIAAQPGDGFTIVDRGPATERTFAGPPLVTSYPAPAWRGAGHDLVLVDPQRKSMGVYDAADPTAVAKVNWSDPRTPGRLKAAGASPDGRRLVVVDETNRVAVRDLADGHAIADLEITASANDSATRNAGTDPGSAAVNASATAAAVVVRDGVAVVDIAGGTITLVEGPARRVSYGGDTLAVQRPTGDVDLYTGLPPAHVRTVTGNTGLLSSFALSGDGAILAQARLDGTVVLRDLSGGTDELMGALPGPALSPKVAIAFGRDNETLAVARPGSDGGTGTLETWTLNPYHWLAMACATANRDLTRFEWERHVGTTPPDNLRCTRAA